LSSAGDWDQFVDELARELVPALVRRLYGFHLVRVRMLRAPSEKLIYLYLVLAEPQSFTGIRRGLGLAMRTVDRALRRLRASGCVRQDDVYLYWVADVKSRGSS
jgi:predicted DNA-binding transcriptional regulator